MLSLKRSLRALALALLSGFLLAGCATLLPMQQFEIPLSRLQREVEARFPFNNRYLELIDVSLSKPVLSLSPKDDRLLASFDAKLLSPLTRQPIEGRMQVSGLLRIDPQRRALVLAEPRLESLGGLADAGNSRLLKLGTMLAEDLLNNTVLYSFAPDAFMVAGQRFNPTRITTRQNSLVVSFEPAR